MVLNWKLEKFIMVSERTNTLTHKFGPDSGPINQDGYDGFWEIDGYKHHYLEGVYWREYLILETCIGLK